ncbi:uncharacterized protein LOC144452888 [Glandiceps talaboti]
MVEQHICNMNDVTPEDVKDQLDSLGKHLKEWDTYCRKDIGGILRKVRDLDFSLQECNPAAVEKRSKEKLDRLKLPRSAGARPRDVVVAKENIPALSSIIGSLYWRVGAKLGLSKDKLDHIRNTSRGNDTKAAGDVVSIWAAKEGTSATVKNLAKVVERYDSQLADCIRELQTADANTLAHAFCARHIYDLVSEQDIFALSLQLQHDYKKVAKELGLSTEVVGIVGDANRDDDINGARKMLQLWMKTDKSMCTWSRLIEAAKKTNVDVAEGIDRVRKQGPLEDCVLEELASRLGLEWEAVGIRLRFTTRQINAIIKEFPIKDMAIVVMFQQFKTKSLPKEDDTHHGVLCAALRDTDRRDLTLLLAGK